MNQQLLQRVLDSPRLPSLPAIAVEVIELVRQQDVNIRQIADTIQHDPALATRILKTVNSSFYGQSHQIATISHALVVLGLNAVKTLALGFSLVPNLKVEQADGFDHIEFWRRSLYTAAAARALSRRAGYAAQEEAFLAGLLQDLGMLALNQALDSEYRELLAGHTGPHAALASFERERFGADHAAIGAELAAHWNLPEMLVESIRHHEAPDDAPEEVRTMVYCVALGNTVADLFGGTAPAETLQTLNARAEAWLDISGHDLEPLLAEVHQDTLEMRRLFNLPSGEMGRAEDVLMKANEALLQLNLLSQKRSSELAQQNQQLSAEASTDSLTGVANRRRLNQFIAERFQAAEREGTALSVIFLDTDHFKRFNDTYGHQVGDMVLVEKARLLKENAPTEALVARYGGEEFAIILPGCDRLMATQLAEQFRQQVEQMPIACESGDSLNVTTSIGVASYEPGIYRRPEMLMKAADQAVYAAKNAGRNCVRIFIPRTPAQSA